MTTMPQALQLIERLSRLLRDEIAAIASGKLGEVAEIYPEKAALLHQVENVFAGSGADLRDHPKAGELQSSLAELRQLIARDLSLLERMTEATGAIAAELDRIRDRHSLSGVYGPDGAKKAKTVPSSQHLDQSL